jgi:hypothetical protein
MANELTVYASVAYEDSEGTEHPAFGVAGDSVSVTTKKFVSGKVSVGTTEEAIPLGEVSSLGYAVFKNLDSTNYVELRMASGASNDHIKIAAGEACCFRFGSDVSAPYLIANTAACQVEYRIYSA